MNVDETMTSEHRCDGSDHGPQRLRRKHGSWGRVARIERDPRQIRAGIQNTAAKEELHDNFNSNLNKIGSSDIASHSGRCIFRNSGISISDLQPCS